MNSKSFQLQKIDEDYYKISIRKKHICDASEIEKNVEEFKGRFEKLKTRLMNKGIPSAELDLAVQELDKNDHNVAEFGIMGKFMYTQNDETVSKIEKREGNVIHVKF